ncbi:MAG: cytochrome c [Chloroflexota bacterium]
MDAPGAQPERQRRRVRILGFAVGVAVVVALATALASQTNLFASRGSSFDTRPATNFSTQELRGRTIYAGNCVSCHGGFAEGGMMDYPPRHNSNGHTWHHPDCQLKQIIREGGDEMTSMMRDMMAPSAAPTMQAFKARLSPEEIDAVLAYIKTMWSPEERELQAGVTRESCPTS